MKNTLLIMALAMITFSACDKEDEPTKSEDATRSSWRYDNAGLDGDKNGTIDQSITAQLQPCMKDNILTLSANGTGVVDEGATKCDANAAQTTAVTWNFTDNETSMYLSGTGITGISGKFKIITLNRDNLVLSKDTTMQTFGSTTVVVSLKH